jgi:hypothetical protein
MHAILRGVFGRILTRKHISTRPNRGSRSSQPFHLQFVHVSGCEDHQQPLLVLRRIFPHTTHNATTASNSGMIFCQYWYKTCLTSASSQPRSSPAAPLPNLLDSFHSPSIFIRFLAACRGFFRLVILPFLLTSVCALCVLHLN